MANVSRIVSANGDVRYQASSTDAGHSDLTSALVLAVEAWKKMPLSVALPAAFSSFSSRLGSWHSRL